jgi:hypothetical protein
MHHCCLCHLSELLLLLGPVAAVLLLLLLHLGC